MSGIAFVHRRNYPGDRRIKTTLLILLASCTVISPVVGDCPDDRGSIRSVSDNNRTVSDIDRSFSPDTITTASADIIEYESMANGRDDFNRIEIILVPEGSFHMGSDSEWADADEIPIHTVHIDSFGMSRYEVTNAQVEQILGWAYDHGRIDLTDTLIQNIDGIPHQLINLADSRLRLENNRFVVSDQWRNRPCTGLTWFGAQALCNYLSNMTGREPCIDWFDWSCDFSKNGYRLPTEAEWEYSCRAGTDTDIFTGPIIYPGYDPVDPNLDVAGWYYGNMHYRAHDVGGKIPNDFGVYDMHGNVWEWCYDWYDRRYYRSSPLRNPRGPEQGIERTKRGGSCFDIARTCRSSFRGLSDPSYSYGNLGFRPAVTIH